MMPCIQSDKIISVITTS